MPVARNPRARPRLMLLAGMPCSGKTSLLVPHLVAAGDRFAALPRFQPGQVREVLARDLPSLDDVDLDRLVARSAPAALRGALGQGTDWVQETDLRDEQVLAAIAVATKLGYGIEMAFIGVAEPAMLAARLSAQDPRRAWTSAEWDLAWRTSLTGLIAVMPVLEFLVVYDNSAPLVSGCPSPREALRIEAGRTVYPGSPLELDGVLPWARPLVAAALVGHRAVWDGVEGGER